MSPPDLVKTGRRLLGGRGRPRQSDLKKATSAAYYAMFHALCKICADCFVGGGGADKTSAAWRRVYRSVQHGFAQAQCRNRQALARFPQGIRLFADRFAELQEKRHEADYDPDSRFQLDEVRAYLDNAETAIRQINAAPIIDRRAFAAWVGVRGR